MSLETVKSLLHDLQDAYAKRDGKNVGSLCDSLFCAQAEPLMIGAGSDEWFFGIEEAKKLFVADWESWGEFTLDFDTLRHEQVGARGWFALRAGVLYQFEDSEKTDRLFLRLIKEAAEKSKPAVARAGEILWLLSHLLHRRESGVRRYLWHVTLSGTYEDMGVGPRLRSLCFALPADLLYPDERIEEGGWERACYEKVRASVAQWNARRKYGSSRRLQEILSAWHEGHAGIEWVSDGLERFVGFAGIICGAAEFLRELQALKSDWRIALEPGNLIIDERDGIVFFQGFGLLERKVCLEKELENVLRRIQNDVYGAEGGETLFRMRRDLSRVLKEAGSGGHAAVSYRIEGVARLSGDTLAMRYFHLSTPFCHILEQKTDAAETIK